MPSSERYGPLVHRSVHHAATLLIAGVVAFLAGNVLTQWAWDYYRSSPTPVYSLTQNYISDLGAIHCGTIGGRYVCSPWHLVFSVSVILLGLLTILGVLLIQSAFPTRQTRTVGLGLLVVSGIGSIGVGLSPEDYNLTVHSISALLGFAGAGLALIALALAMLRDTRWDGYRVFTALCGLVDLGALGLFISHTWGPIGVGGMERLIVAPVLLWSVVISAHLLRIPTYSSPKLPKVAG